MNAAFSVGLALLWGLGLLLTQGVRFGGGEVPPATSRSLVFVAALPLILLVLPALHRSERVRRPGPRFLLAFALVFGAFVLGTVIDDAFVAVLFACLWPLVALQIWVLTGGSERLRIAATPLLLLALCAYGVELFGSEFGARSVVWGREETFSTLRGKPPYIEEGGRLLPLLDVYMRSRERPQGARLRTNSLGLRNTEEIPAEVGTGELRVLSLGDSFSIGMQIDQERFFGTQLERNLEEMRAGDVTVVNAEISGPTYGYYFFQEYGPRYKPEIVLLGICGNDLLQTDALLGANRLFRLDPDGSLVARSEDKAGKSPIELYLDLAYPEVSPQALEAGKPRRFWRTYRYWLRIRLGSMRWLGKFCRFQVFETILPVAWVMETGPARMHSFVWDTERQDGRMRLFDGTKNLGYFYKRENPYVEPIYAKFFELLKAFDRRAKARGQRVCLVIFPQRYQVHPDDWAAIKDFWNLDQADFDLELYDRRIVGFCEENDILCYDLLEPFRDAAARTKLYLPEGDIHFNAAGHRLAARKVAEFLLEHAVR